jgi:glyoxylase-like metal-dependent hydrolase (beta-lactamase superfamily II)
VNLGTSRGAIRSVGILGAILFCAAAFGQAAPIAYDRLVTGFLPEVKNDAGYAAGNGAGFASDNPWGQYTAYLLSTNSKGQRTWRIEHYLPVRDHAQGSTMYLLEGSRRALLIDTANPAKFVPGVNDLKTVVRHLLGHENDGSPRARPLDFVVANTHSHSDHTGENVLMSDRTVYYMDLDWPRDAPANYVPIREGGGLTTHGDGHAVGEIDLGGRKLRAIAMPPHTPGSTGYLDEENRMLFSGDALGSAFPYIQGGPFSTFVQTMHHVVDVTQPFADLAVLPAHFYQIALYDRGQPPLNGSPLGRPYLLDLENLADDIAQGKAVAEPYFVGGRGTVWSRRNSARIVYSLTTLYKPGEAPTAAYQVIHIPGNFPQKWVPDSPAKTAVFHIRSEFFLIHDSGAHTSYLVKGSRGAVLISAGPLDPDVEKEAARLSGSTPMETLQLDGPIALRDGEKKDLGMDRAGRPLVLEALSFSPQHMTLLDPADRILFSGESLGMQAPLDGTRPDTPLAEYASHLAAWRRKSDGRYDSLYTARNSQWFTSPAFVDHLQALVGATVAGDAAYASSDGDRDAVASLAGK